MPYIKHDRDPMLKVIGAYGLERSRALAPIIGRCSATAASRIKRPEDLTLGELRLLASHGHVPIDEIRAAI